MQPKARLLIATTNQGKLDEYRRLWHEDSPPIQFLSLRDVSVIDYPIESGETFQEIAVSKSLFYSKLVPEMYVLAEDSGLCVDSLGGEPGVFSARYAGAASSDGDNIKKLLESLKNISDRSAGFISALSLSRNGENLEVVTGEVRGEILDEPRGERGFGYDPVFFIRSHGKTFAEIPIEEKNKLSHRYMAFQKMVPLLVNRLRNRGV